MAAAIFGCLGIALSADEAAFFREADPLGFILFARNVQDPAQVLALTSQLRDAVGRDAPVLVDQEGGRVQRLRAPHWREWVPPLEQSDRTLHGPLERGFWLRGRIIASELRAVGIDTCCSPSGDIAHPTTHPFLRNRCLGHDRETVLRAARALSDGLIAGGVIPVMKHIPGHGRATVDSHLEPPRVTAEAEDLHDTDFAVFAGLADLPVGMTGHIVFDALDPDHPATASPACIAAIRDEIGFDGLLLTDDLSMQALGGTHATRAASSIAAGCDVALHCNGNRTEMEQVLAGAGRLSAQAAARADFALTFRGSSDLSDIAALDAEYAELMAGRADG
jgi:beta-N-acetylhexosaminidase